MINHDSHKNKVTITNFFNKIKIIQIDTILEINLLIIQLIIINQMMKNTIIKIINDITLVKDLVLPILTKQISSNHTHEMNKHDNLEITQHLTTIIFNNTIQVTPNHTNQLKYKTKFHCHTIYNNMK